MIIMSKYRIVELHTLLPRCYIGHHRGGHHPR